MLFFFLIFFLAWLSLLTFSHSGFLIQNQNIQNKKGLGLEAGDTYLVVHHAALKKTTAENLNNTKKDFQIGDRNLMLEGAREKRSKWQIFMQCTQTDVRTDTYIQ